MITINAFTFQFDYTEDRIRMVANLDNGGLRADFWLTRRLAVRLLDAGNQMVHETSRRVSESPAPFRQAAARFDHEEARQNMEVSTQSIPRSEATRPELLHRIDVAHNQGRYRLRLFGEHDPDEVAAVCVLTYSELHQILHLIHAGGRKLEWGLPELFSDPSFGQSPTLQ